MSLSSSSIAGLLSVIESSLLSGDRLSWKLGDKSLLEMPFSSCIMYCYYYDDTNEYIKVLRPTSRRRVELMLLLL